MREAARHGLSMLPAVGYRALLGARHFQLPPCGTTQLAAAAENPEKPESGENRGGGLGDGGDAEIINREGISAARTGRWGERDNAEPSLRLIVESRFQSRGLDRQGRRPKGPGIVECG